MLSPLLLFLTYQSIQYIINSKDSPKVDDESKNWFNTDFLEKIISKASKFGESSNKVGYCYQQR